MKGFGNGQEAPFASKNILQSSLFDFLKLAESAIVSNAIL
jgi:hypothetical protein